MSQPFSTIANPHDRFLVETMAKARYESGRIHAPSLPTWERTTDEFRDAERRDTAASLSAATEAGFRIGKA